MGGTGDSGSKYVVMLIKAMRRSALAIVAISVAYSLAALSGYTSISPYFSQSTALIMLVLIIAYVVWTRTGIFSVNRTNAILQFVSLHILGIMFPLFVAGFMSPMTALWIVMLTMVDITFGRKAMILSSGIVVSVAFIDAFLPLASGLAVTITNVIDHIIYVSIIVVLSWYVGSIRNVTARQNKDILAAKSRQTLEQSRLMTLINSLNEAIISVNSEGIVQLYNAATLNLLDTNQSLSGKKLDKVMTLFDSSGEVFHLYKTLSSGAPSIIRDDLVHHFDDDEAINIAISSSRIRGNHDETLGYILVLRDITRDKSLDEERDEFISVVSHELRTPITITEGTISNVRLLIDRGATPKVVSDALDVAHEQTLYLSRMINDLSTLSRAERGVSDEKEHINVQEFIHEMYKDFSPKAAAAGLTLNLDISGHPGYIKASRLYIEEILQNFLTNAIKYTQKGHVDFTVAVANGQVVFSVKDTGIGISKADQAKIFDKFYRSEDYRTRETKGTGLGLYIVQKLAKKLGTQVEIESKLNHGSTFRIRIPLASNLDKAGGQE